MKKVIRLAIVDDHELIRDTWRMVLERDDRIDVIATCASGHEALICAEAQAPDVMLMDINMSPMNGFDATKKIVQLFPAIKIIGTSINNQVAYARTIMRAGAKGFVTKNSPSTEMLDAIVRVNEGSTFICKEIQEKLQGKELI